MVFLIKFSGTFYDFLIYPVHFYYHLHMTDLCIQFLILTKNLLNLYYPKNLSLDMQVKLE